MQMAVLFILVSLHELGHAATANALGYDVAEVTLLPFGGVARLRYGSIGFHPRDEARIAVAGPCVNLFAALLAWVCLAARLWPHDFVHLVIRYNVWIAVFNLLPGLPLDGGRMLRAARSRRLGYDAATEEAYNLALVLAALLLAVGAAAMWAGFPHLGVVVMGVFLAVCAWTGKRASRSDTIRFLDAKRRQTMPQTEPVRALSASQHASLADVVRLFAPDRYHMVYVRDDRNEVTAVLEEQEILDALFDGGWTLTLDTLISRSE
ncbi:MAG: M50 family metallopeptidase [Alicyclobacillus sp.]|nr:M50 family metallopeptidase [Alicyclobacillus sp.]